MGLSSTRIGEPTRRDRLLLVSAFAMALLTLLGATGERLGMDRLLKSNTSKTRSHSLFRQGCMLYELIPNMPAPRDCRYNWAYLFGAVCPARDTGAALVLPYADKHAMTLQRRSWRLSPKQSHKPANSTGCLHSRNEGMIEALPLPQDEQLLLLRNFERTTD